MHSRVVPGCAITTKGLTGTFEKCRSDMLVIRDFAGCWSLDGRERLHKTDSGGSVFCGGELTANAERVYSRKSGRQRFSFVVVSMDWRRCTPEWSYRRCHYP
jgi:hypothetical protein